jgi:hypothetical protein
MEGYTYEVFDQSNNFLGWIPFDANQFLTEAKFEYTILTKKITANSEAISANANISLYPNPTNGNQTISINSKELEDLNITLIDIQGKIIKQIFNGKSNSGITQVESNVEDLPSAMYIYEIKLGDNISHLRFLKQ